MQSQKTLPSGLKLIKVLLVLSIIFTAIGILALAATAIMAGIAQKAMGIASPVNVLDIAFAIAVIYDIFSIFLAIYVFRAIRKPTISRYGVSQKLLAVDVILSVAFIFLGYQGLFANIFSIITSGLTIWYFIQLKGYFATGQIDRAEPRVKKANKTFITLMIIGIVASILVPVVISSITEVSQVKSTVATMAAFKGKTIEQGISYCDSLAPNDKDRCYIQLIAAAENTGNKQVFSEKGPANPVVCTHMSTDDGRNACYALLSRCDLVTNSRIQSLCQYASSLVKSASTTAR